MRVKEIFQIKLLQIFQSITRVDIYICLELIFKNFRKLQIIMDVVEVENINRQNFGTSKQTHYAEKNCLQYLNLSIKLQNLHYFKNNISASGHFRSIWTAVYRFWAHLIWEPKLGKAGQKKLCERKLILCKQFSFLAYQKSVKLL